MSGVRSGADLERPRAVALDSVVILDVGAPQRTVGFIAWLRDQHSQTTDVAWRAVVDPRIDAALLYHLPPPLPAVDGGSPEWLARWWAAHRPAMCYYRVGPGFIQIKDVRQATSAARFVLDEPELVDAFTVCLRPRRLDALAERQRHAVLALNVERLVLRVGDWVTTLPTRMRRWPVPSQVV